MISRFVKEIESLNSEYNFILNHQVPIRYTYFFTIYVRSLLENLKSSMIPSSKMQKNPTTLSGSYLDELERKYFLRN